MGKARLAEKEANECAACGEKVNDPTNHVCRDRGGFVPLSIPREEGHEDNLRPA